MRGSLSDYVEMVLTQGGTFEGGFILTDDAGVGIDSSWRGRLEIRTGPGGDLVATFAETGADGTLAITAHGQVLLVLPSTATEAIASTADSLGLNSTVYTGDVEVWRSGTPTVRYKPEMPFRVFVRPEVTTG